MKIFLSKYLLFVSDARISALIFLLTIVLLQSTTIAQVKLPKYDRMILHNTTITTDSVVHQLLLLKVEILDSTSFFTLVTGRMDSIQEGRISKYPWVLAIDSLELPQTNNDKSRLEIGVNRLQPSPYSSVSNPFNLDGAGVNVGVWDAMAADAHGDFDTRLHIVETQTCAGQDHSTHVTGTVAGTGTLSTPQYKYAGMAPKADIYAWSMRGPGCSKNPPYPFKEVELGVLNQQIVESTNSWGFPMEIRDANGTIIGYDCSKGGKYDTYCAEYDNVVRVKNVSVFFAAANERGYPGVLSTCGLASGFSTLTAPGTSKNVITVGAVNSTGVMTSFSSWGPTKDGRLKPDCVADGSAIVSTGLSNTYTTMNGTSMACPAAAGGGALLIQRYRQRNSGITPQPDVLKNIMLNTCVDKGNPGPDYKFGYGVLDIPSAVRMIDDNRIRAGVITNTGDIQQFTFTVKKPCPKRIMLTYSDYQGVPSAPVELVNDLDLEVVEPNGTTIHLPLTLDPNNPNTAALALANHRDNVEQVVVSNPANGLWTIRVRGTHIDAVAGAQQFCVTWADDCDDLYMQDSPLDLGIEPNLETGPIIYASDDIWVRNIMDGVQMHQNPKALVPNFVYVNVRNRGLATGSAKLHLYWGKASTYFSWPTSWNGTDPVCGTLGSGELTPPITVTVPAGQVIVAGPFQWTPPDPLSFTCFATGQEKHHFCLLARLESIPTAPNDGMSYTETSSTGGNTWYNNDIVWKNLSVVDLLGNIESQTGVLIRGDLHRNIIATIHMKSPVDSNHNSFFANGSIKLRLSTDLYLKWKRAGKPGKFDGSNDTARSIQFGHEDAWIGGLTIDSNKTEAVTVAFNFDKKIPADSALFLVDLVQYGVSADTLLPDGGERFAIQYHQETGDVSLLERNSSSIKLEQNSPNPAMHKTTIGFSIPQAEDVRLVLCDILGREIRTFTHQRYEAGEHFISVDVNDVPSGTYIYRIITAENSVAHSLVVMH